MSFVEQDWFEYDKPLQPYFFTKHHDSQPYEVYFIEIIGNQICIEYGKRNSRIDLNMYTPIPQDRSIIDSDTENQKFIMNHANELIKEKCSDGFVENKRLTELYRPMYADNNSIEIEECGITFKKSRQLNNKRLQMMLVRARLQKENERKKYQVNENDYDSDDSDQLDITHTIREDDLFGSESESEDETWNNPISTPYEGDNDEIDDVDICNNQLNGVVTEENEFN